MSGNTDRWPGITFHPGMRGGYPVIGGTGLRLETALEQIWHSGIDWTCETWSLTREQALVAAWYGGTFGIVDAPTPKGRFRRSPWRDRFGTWARENNGKLWRGEYAEIPDPPGEDGD